MLNQVFLQGAVTEAELLEFSSSRLLKVRLAVTTGSRAGDQTNHPLVHVWNPSDKLVSAVAAGVMVFVSAMVQTREWEFQGQPRVTTEIVAREFTVLGAVSSKTGSSEKGLSRRAVKVA